MPGLLRSFSPTDSLKPLAGSSLHVDNVGDEIDENRRDQHFLGSNTTVMSTKYGSLKVDNNSDGELDNSLKDEIVKE